MWIRTIVLLCCLVTACLTVDEHRPKKQQKSEDSRGKRNLQYSISHHYAGPHSFRLERRISTNGNPAQFTGQLHHGSNTPHFAGPPRIYNHPNNKGSPGGNRLPPYAVQMEPLVHYSQRDPLYRGDPPSHDRGAATTRSLSLNEDPQNQQPLFSGQEIRDDTNNHVSERRYYGPPPPPLPHPQIIEKPIYIKEPEPIIEIIIKESNITLPPPPTPPTPPPQKKKKEQVQVFYVKYQKNPNGGYGKDAIIYDKPIPAISPPIPEEPEEEPPEAYPNPPEYVTQAPLPQSTTTLRTIIRPDSETYHSPSGIKVTFGKEGFDYYKRSNKPEDLVARPQGIEPQQTDTQNHQHGFAQGRQLQHFPQFPPSFHHQQRPPSSRPSFVFPPRNSEPHLPTSLRHLPQPYRPFSFNQPVFNNNNGPPPFRPSQPQVNIGSRQILPHPQPQQQYSTLPKYVQQFPPISRPQSPPQFNPQQTSISQVRQPVPYQPFDSVRQPQQQLPQFKSHHTFFSTNQQLPLTGPPQSFNQPQPQQSPAFTPHHQTSPNHLSQNFVRQSQPSPNQLNQNNFAQNQLSQSQVTQNNLNQNHLSHNPVTQNNQLSQNRVNQNSLTVPQNQSPFQNHQERQRQQYLNKEFNEPPRSDNNLIPPGSQVVPALSKFEQHISTFEPSQSAAGQQPQSLALQNNNKNNNINNKDAHNQQNQQFNFNVNSNSQQKLNQQLNSQLLNQQKIEAQFKQPQFQNQHELKNQPKLESQFTQSQFQNLNQQLLNEKQSEAQFRHLQFQNSPNHNEEQNVQPSQQVLEAQFKQLEIQEQLRQANALQEAIRQPSKQGSSSQQVSSFGQSASSTNFYQSTSRPSATSNQQSTTRQPSISSTTQEPEKPSTTTKDPKELNAQLPDEIPDDLREQLLSSGILNNAHISILDYDKVGDIPLSALPPDQLANFFQAGGGQQIEAAGSELHPQIVSKDGLTTPVENSQDKEEDILSSGNDSEIASASEIREVRILPGGGNQKSQEQEVEMKVVHYDPETKKGQQVQDSYVKDDATQLDPVVLNDEKYNRYLPLKVNGTQFPIPDVPELKNKRITSVVVLAPVAYDFSSDRRTRETENSGESSKDSVKNQDPNEEILLIEGEALRKLLENPTMENYKRFLESENRTKSDKQAVILLVTGGNGTISEREIYMYDVATQTVSRLNGELSAAFVDAAEANAKEDAENLNKSSSEEASAASESIESRIRLEGPKDSKNPDTGLGLSPDLHSNVQKASASGIVETRIRFEGPQEHSKIDDPSLNQYLDLDSSASNKVSTIAALDQNLDETLQTDASENFQQSSV